MTKAPKWHDMLPAGLASLLSAPNAWAGSEPDRIVPSYALGSDGPSIASVFCLYGDLLCEIVVTAPGTSRFDFVRLNTIPNLRVDSSSVQIGEGDQAKTYRSTQVTLHHFGADFQSRLTFVGDDDGEWLNETRALFDMEQVKL